VAVGHVFPTPSLVLPLNSGTWLNVGTAIRHKKGKESQRAMPMDCPAEADEIKTCGNDGVKIRTSACILFLQVPRDI
jgi:hypothetical protein